MRRDSSAFRIARAAALLSVGGALISLGASGAFGQEEPARPRPLAGYFPRQDLVVFVEFDGLDAHAEAWKKTAAYRLLNETSTGAMLEQVAIQLADRAFRASARRADDRGAVAGPGHARVPIRVRLRDQPPGAPGEADLHRPGPARGGRGEGPRAPGTAPQDEGPGGDAGEAGGPHAQRRGRRPVAEPGLVGGGGRPRPEPRRRGRGRRHDRDARRDAGRAPSSIPSASS